MKIYLNHVQWIENYNKIINKYNDELSTQLKQITICEIDCPKSKKSYASVIKPLINTFDKNLL